MGGGARKGVSGGDERGKGESRGNEPLPAAARAGEEDEHSSRRTSEEDRSARTEHEEEGMMGSGRARGRMQPALVDDEQSGLLGLRDKEILGDFWFGKWRPSFSSSSRAAPPCMEQRRQRALCF